MNSVQFNIILGFFSILGFFVSSTSTFSYVPYYLLAIFAFPLYVGEFWAFLYKLKIARTRELVKITRGNPNTREAMGGEPGCMMVYAFLMRFVFRIFLGLVFLMIFGGSIDKELNNVQIVFMILIVLFELFNFMYSMYETHIFKLSGEYAETDKELENYWESEKKWRNKNYPLLEKSGTRKKEIVANIILLFMAFLTTHFLWGAMNHELKDFIIRTEKSHESILFAVCTVICSCFALCLFFLMPVRLAFWVEERMKADKKPELMHYRLSLLFAGLSICSPSLIQLFVSFVLR